ncbi:MAG TPA: type II secretion system protein, partial [Burkholderiales bacterium]|nr:type II secretion system protein [Burkholderiales bacterium]
MKARGFTLVELLIVVAIMALLASIAAPLAELSYQRGKEQELRTALREIREAIDTYKRAADDGKIEKSADSSGYPPSLKTLVEGVPDKSTPEKSTLYFLRRIPRDPISGEDWGVRAYASPANDPQPGKDVYDVYSKSEEIGLNKVP